MTNGKIITLKEGQLITGRKKLSEATGIPESTIEDCLRLLENEQQVQQQKTTKYRLITIVNWKEYQESDSKPTTGRQPADTYKNNKNDKNLSANAETVDIPVGRDTHEKPTKLPKDEKAISLVGWASSRRGFEFTSAPAQLGAIGRAKRAGISPSRLKERWAELENETWRNGFDWVDVVKSFDKRA